DMVFAVRVPRAATHNTYSHLRDDFGKTLKRMGNGLCEKEEYSITPKNKRHHRRGRITLHSFRRFVKTTISDLGYGDFSEWFIGHAQSTYYTQPEQKRIEIFNKIAPSLTFLDYSSMERHGADIKSRLDALEKENMTLKQYILNLNERMRRELEEIRKRNAFRPKPREYKPIEYYEEKLRKFKEEKGIIT